MSTERISDETLTTIAIGSAAGWDNCHWLMARELKQLRAEIAAKDARYAQAAEIVANLEITIGAKDAEIERLRAEASWAATHRSELLDLRAAFAKLEKEYAFMKDAPAAELPRLVACAIIVRDGQILLEKRAPANVDGLDNHWDLPGGKVEARETPQEAAEREIKEELGISVKAKRLCAEPLPSVWYYPGKGERHWLLIGVVCELNEEPTQSSSLQWFPTNDLPATILAADAKLIAQALNGQDASRISS